MAAAASGTCCCAALLESEPAFLPTRLTAAVVAGYRVTMVRGLQAVTEDLDPQLPQLCQRHGGGPGSTLPPRDRPKGAPARSRDRRIVAAPIALTALRPRQGESGDQSRALSLNCGQPGLETGVAIGIAARCS